MSIQKLHYENISGILVRREGLLSWRCPLCKAEGQSLEVMRTCPECGSKEATLPGAQPAPSHALDDSATIAGLESAVTHLSVLLDSFRALLVEVNDVCGRDGHGGQLEDGELEIIDKVRAAISMTEAPPCAKGE